MKIPFDMGAYITPLCCDFVISFLGLRLGIQT